MKILGLLSFVLFLSACANKAAVEQAPIKSTTNQGQATQKNESNITNQNTSDKTQPTTADTPEINSNNPDIKELNSLANDIDSLNSSAQDLNENQDLSAE